MSEGVRARSRTSARSVSLKSNSKKLKSRRSGGTRCSRIASRQRLRKKTSSPTKRYAGRSFPDCTSETNRSVCANDRIRNPPKYSTRVCGRTHATSARKPESLPQRNWVDRWKFDIAGGKDTKDFRRELFRPYLSKKLSCSP